MLNIKQQYVTKNPCYKEGRKITPKGIMVHSTATPGVLAADWYSRWNKADYDRACVHAFVDNTVVCQHLPWNHRAWHAGASANNTHIGFEICEPKNWKTDAIYFKAAYTNAVELAAYLCKKYSLPVSSIVSHKEGYKKGIASNHGDPDHWWKYFGYTMNKFRSDVQKVLNGGKISVKITTTTSNVKPVLQKGSKGNDVKTLQTRLNRMRELLKLDYAKLNVDGDFGNNTLTAVKLFQKARRLTVDGIVGANTWAALGFNYGDVNKDGKVNAVDSQLVLKSSVGKATLTAEQKKIADINADGKVDAKDAQTILKRAVGK